MGRKAGNSTANKLADTIKQGDLVWVLYRKVEWPALVKRVYLSKVPKKATYNFLPIEKHPNVFSTELKNIRPFKSTDLLSDSAGDGQRESYEIAQKILSGELEYPDESKSTPSVVKNGKKNGSSKATSNRSNFDETSGSEAGEMEEKQSSQSDDSIFAPRENTALSAFGDKPSTSRGVGRPATKHAEPVKPKKVEKKQQPEKNLLKSDPNSVRIGLSSKKVVAENIKKKKREVIDEDEAAVDYAPLNFSKDDVVLVNVEDGMWPGLVVNVMEGEVRYRPFPLKSNAAVISTNVEAVALLLLDNMDELLDSAGELKNLTEALQDAKRFLCKRNGVDFSDDDDDTKNDGPAAAANPVVNSSTENDNLRNVIIDSPEDKEEKAVLVMEEVTKRGRKPSKRGVNAVDEKKKNPEELQGGEGDQHIQNGKSCASTTNVKRPKLSFFAIITSDDTRAYLNNVWSKQIESPRHVEYTYPSRVEDLSFSFRTGGLLTLHQTELVVSEMHKWITLCTKIPKMSQLIEMHYIANFVLPEACVYALSISETLSTNEAIAKYQKLIDDERIGSVNGAVRDKQANETTNGYNNVNSGNNTLSLSSLALAAELMKNQEGIA